MVIMWLYLQIDKEAVGVATGDHVVVVGQKAGCVMYVGHIEGAQDKYSVFVGLQLDAPGSLKLL